VDEASAAALARPILRGKFHPTALLCATDRIAIGAMSAARELGFSIPGDLSIIGFDDLAIGRVTDPPLTTMGQSVGQAGHHLAEMLLALLDGRPAHDLQEIWPVELIRRGSDGPPPASAAATSPNKAHDTRPNPPANDRLRAAGG